MPYATLEALRAAVPASGSTDHEDHTRGIVDALIALAGRVHVLEAIGLRSSDPITLTSADILALHDTPVEVVAAPGVGKCLVPHNIVITTSGGTTPYTVPDGIVLLVGDAEWQNVSDPFGYTGAQMAVFPPGSRFYATSDVENRAITIYSSDDNPTDGDGSVTFTVWYSIEDVP